MLVSYMAAKMAILELSYQHHSRNISYTYEAAQLLSEIQNYYMQSDLTAKNVTMVLNKMPRPISSRYAILVRFGIKYIMQAENAQTRKCIYAALLKSLRRSTVHFNDLDILAPLDGFACTKQVLLHRLVHLTVHAG